MLQAQLCHGICHPARLEHIKRIWRFSGCNITKRTGAGTNLTHDHHRGVPLAPTFANIGAAGLFADGDQIIIPHYIARRFIASAGGRFHANPIRFFWLSIIRTVGFFRMTLFGLFKIWQRSCPFFATQYHSLAALQALSAHICYAEQPIWPQQRA